MRCFINVRRLFLALCRTTFWGVAMSASIDERLSYPCGTVAGFKYRVAAVAHSWSDLM